MARSLINKPLRQALMALTAVLSLTTVSLGQEVSSPTNPTIKIKIKNFGQMDERFYRGGQPKEKDYKDLALIGIRTVIDLREDPEEYEKPMVEQLGMRYINIPMIAKKYPTAEVTELFLKTVSDPSSGKVFVHCAGGRHRTGAMGAVYRYQFYNWNFEQVYKEMKQYDFYTSWGHGAFKDFVKDYYSQMQRSKPTSQQ